jgi:hypothetical protein
MQAGGRLLMAAIAVAAAGLISAQQTQAQSRGASMEIRLVARVPVFCGIREDRVGRRISGEDSHGRRITVPGGEGNFRVRCNTPYALGLERNYRTVESDGSEHRAAGQPVGSSATSYANLQTGSVNTGSVAAAALPNPALPHVVAVDGSREMVAQDYGVTLQVGGIGEIYESRCVLASVGAGNRLCHAFAGPGDLRRGAPQAQVNLIITGSQRVGAPGDASAPPLMRLEATEAGPLVEIPLFEPRRLPVQVGMPSTIHTGSIAGDRGARGRSTTGALAQERLAMRDTSAPEPAVPQDGTRERSAGQPVRERVRQLDHVTLSLTGKF